MSAIQRALSLAVLAAALMANVSQAAPVVLNSSFDNPVTTTLYGPIDDWAQVPFPSGLGGFPYLTGENAFGGPVWNNGTVPGEGISGKVGFIQVFPSVATLSLTQSVSGFIAGPLYTLSYYENAREGTSTPLVEVLVDGNVVVASHLDPAVGGLDPFRLVTSLPFSVGGTSATVELRVTQVSGGDDATALFDHITIDAVPIPEPGSLVLFGLGAVGLVVAARRRRTA